MDEILGPFERRGEDLRKRRVKHLEQLIRITAEIGAELFRHPATWEFSWESKGNYNKYSRPTVVFPAITKTSDLDGRKLKKPLEKVEAEMVKKEPSRTTARIGPQLTTYRDSAHDDKHGESMSMNPSSMVAIPTESTAPEPLDSREVRSSSEVPGAYPPDSSEGQPISARAPNSGLTKSDSLDEIPKRSRDSKDSADAHQVESIVAEPGHRNHQFLGSLTTKISKPETRKPRTKDSKIHNSQLSRRRPDSSSRSSEDPSNTSIVSSAPGESFNNLDSTAKLID